MAVALLAAALFLYGFASSFRGDLGSRVTPGLVPASRQPERQQTVRLLLLGDSLARGTGDQSGLGIAGNIDRELDQRKIPRSSTVNLAINGARTADLLEQLRHQNVRQLVSRSNVVILSIGGNDLFGEAGSLKGPPANPDQLFGTVLERVGQAVDLIREMNPEARIFVVGLYNPFSDGPGGKKISELVNRWNARLIERFEDDPDLTVVQTSDLFSHRNRLSLDRFHPAAEGYRLIGRRIAESL